MTSRALESGAGGGAPAEEGPGYQPPPVLSSIKGLGKARRTRESMSEASARPDTVGSMRQEILNQRSRFHVTDLTEPQHQQYMLIVLVTGRLLVPIELRREGRSQEQVEGSWLDSGSAGTNPRCAQTLAARARVLDLVRDGRLPGCLGRSTVYGENGISPAPQYNTTSPPGFEDTDWDVLEDQVLHL